MTVLLITAPINQRINFRQLKFTARASEDLMRLIRTTPFFSLHGARNAIKYPCPNQKYQNLL